MTSKRKRASRARRQETEDREAVFPRNPLKRGGVTEPQAIETYVEHCRKLLLDINHVLDDREFAKTGTLRYAVDFSEIHAYVLPGESTESAPFVDGWVTADPLRQFSILSDFLSQKNIVLVEPHALELWSFYDRMISGAFAAETKRVAAALEQRQRLLEDQASEKMIMRAVSDNPLTPDEIKGAISYFEKHAPELLAFARGANLSSLVRLRTLLEKAPFVALETLVPDVEKYLDHDRIDKRFKVISDKRIGERDHSRVHLHNMHMRSRLDARAVEFVLAANRQLAPKVRLLLVGRSINVATAVEEEATVHTAAWEQVSAFVRHPRIFSGAYIPAPGMTETEFVQKLNLRRDSLALFIRAAKSALDDAAEDAHLPAMSSQKLWGLMRDIQEEWSSGETLATALQPLDKHETYIGDSAKLARDLLAFLRDHSALMQAVRDRIVTIFDETARDLGVLGARLQSSEAGTLGSVLYPLHFENGKLATIVRELAQRWTIDTAEAVSLFDLRDRQDCTTYELLLAIAVALGAIGRWRVAGRYAHHAVSLAQHDKITPNEAHFHRAVCMRKGLQKDRDPKHQYDALNMAQEQITIARNLLGHDDARYLHESGVVATLQRELTETAEADFLQSEIHDRAEIEKTLTSALDLNPSNKLTVLLLNTLTYLYLLKPLDKRKAKDYLEALEDTLSQHYPPRDTWPTNTLDTVIWARYQLREADDTKALDGWIGELDLLASRKHLTKAEQSSVLSHANQIRTTLKRVVPEAQQ